MNVRNDVLPWYKQRWPWLLIAGPATVVVAGIVTVWLAVVSNDGLVTDDYYKQGLAVNQQLQRDQQAQAMGLQADLMRADHNLRLFFLNGPEAAALPEKLTLRIAHPTRAGQDQIVEMKGESPGLYSGKLDADIRGRWLVSLEDPSGKWRLHAEWMADAAKPLRLVAKTTQE
ncbi:FixH family protein [Dechloromonas sp. ZS-1]|uniref:FixH family protein n=1 Tax=Dechloromonas sp. ZS-1 TaxID=3138067 RepID=UPI0031FC3A29